VISADLLCPDPLVLLRLVVELHESLQRRQARLERLDGLLMVLDDVFHEEVTLLPPDEVQHVADRTHDLDRKCQMKHFRTPHCTTHDAGARRKHTTPFNAAIYLHEETPFAELGSVKLP